MNILLLYLLMKARAYDVLQHLVLTPFTVDMKEVELLRSTCHVVKYRAGVYNFQLDFLLKVTRGIFHSKSSLALEVSLRQENGPGAVSESVIMNLHLPLVCLHVVTPDLLQVGVVLGHWLVDVQHTESNLEWE